MARGYGNGEAVTFSFGPLISYQLQEAAQKRAENALLDRQVATDMAKLTPEGIRPQDMPQFLKQYNTLKDLSIRNRDAIRNPAKNPQAYQDFLDARAALQSTIAESKGAKEMNKTAYSFYSKNAGKIDQDEFRNAARLFNAPIGTPEFEKGKSYDITQAIFKPEQFDQNKWQLFLNNAVKPVEKVTTEELPTGQHKNIKVKYTDPIALQNVVSQAYDNDLQHAQKFYNSQFDKLDDGQKQELEGYVKKYIPDFEIKSGKDLAVAANIYGQVEKDMGETVTGSPWKSNQAFQRSQQDRAFKHAEEMAAKAASKKDEGFYLVDKMATDLKSGNLQDVIAPLQATSSSGVETFSLKNGVTPTKQFNTLKRLIKENAVDSDTRILSEKDFKDGVIVVAVPKINSTTKQPIKGQYDYMAVSRNATNAQTRLNQLLNHAKGGTKALPDKYYKQTAAPTTQVYDFTPGSLDVVEDDVEDDNQDDN